MKTIKIEISSAKKEMAEIVAFFHAIVGPVISGLMGYIYSQKLLMVIIASGVYILIFTGLNLFRWFLDKSELDNYKTDKYFEYLKFFLSVVGLLTVLLFVTIWGVYHV